MQYKQHGKLVDQSQNNANANAEDSLSLSNEKVLDAAVGASFLSILLAFVGVANPRYRISFIRIEERQKEAVIIKIMQGQDARLK